MESESFRILQKRRVDLTNELTRLRASIAPLEEEVAEIDRGLKAMAVGKMPPLGAEASRNAVAHFVRKANPDAQDMTIKQLVVAALGEHLMNGATAIELLDFFSRHWGRQGIMRTSLSPQLSRLKDSGIIELRGKVWHLVRNENEPPEGEPKGGSETALNTQNKEATEC